MTTVDEARALSEERLLRIPNVGPKAVADISAALADRALRPDDTIELLGLPAGRVISERDRELVRMRQRGATRRGDRPAVWDLLRACASDPGPRRVVMSDLAVPATVCLDPFRALGCGRWQWQIEDRDRLSQPVSVTDRRDLVVVGQLHAGDGDRDTEQRGLERNGEVVLEHREQAGDLLVLVVAVDGRLLDQFVESFIAGGRSSRSRHASSSRVGWLSGARGRHFRTAAFGSAVALRRALSGPSSSHRQSSAVRRTLACAAASPWRIRSRR